MEEWISFWMNVRIEWRLAVLLTHQLEKWFIWFRLFFPNVYICCGVLTFILINGIWQCKYKQFFNVVDVFIICFSSWYIQNGWSRFVLPSLIAWLPFLKAWIKLSTSHLSVLYFLLSLFMPFYLTNLRGTGKKWNTHKQISTWISVTSQCTHEPIDL